MASTQMRPLGALLGMRFYWASRDVFLWPGLIVWTGKRHRRLLPDPGDISRSTFASGSDAELSERVGRENAGSAPGETVDSALAEKVRQIASRASEVVE